MLGPTLGRIGENAAESAERAGADRSRVFACVRFVYMRGTVYMCAFLCWNCSYVLLNVRCFFFGSLNDGGVENFGFFVARSYRFLYVMRRMRMLFVLKEFDICLVFIIKIIND